MAGSAGTHPNSPTPRPVFTGRGVGRRGALPSGRLERDLARHLASKHSVATGPPLGLPLTVAATLGEGQGAEPRYPDELLALLAESVPAHRTAG